MSDTDPKPGPLASPPPTVRQKPGVLVAFLLVAAGLLAVDLYLKAWSFENIADRPVQLESASDGPLVYVKAKPEELKVLDGKDGYVRADELYSNVPRGIVPGHESTTVVPGLLDLQLTLNTGAVFGLGKGARPLFIGVSLIATVVIFILVLKSPANAYVYHFALAMILSGALGNLYDRVRFSAVRDMLHMLPGTRLWPWIFNIADVALVVGVGLVLVLSFIHERRQSIAKSTVD